MPKLIIIAGCNGAGKSTFASSLLPDELISFDYDKRYIEIYNTMPDSELKDKFANDKATEDFENAIKRALDNQFDFCYETNFDTHPLYWAEKFKECGYKINLIFFCLDNQDIARHRIHVRTEFKGHFVDDRTIDLKWKVGYENVNLHFNFFDSILFIDNSKQNDVYTNLLQIENEKVLLMTNTIPNYFEKRFPDIYKLIKTS